MSNKTTLRIISYTNPVLYHKYLKQENYELTRHELEEDDAPCHGNWIEIQRLYEYMDELKLILEKTTSIIRKCDDHNYLTGACLIISDGLAAEQKNFT